MPLEVAMKGSWGTTVAMAMAKAMVKAMENHHTRDSAGDGVLWYLLTLLRFVLCVMMVSNNKQFRRVSVSSFFLHSSCTSIPVRVASTEGRTGGTLSLLVRVDDLSQIRFRCGRCGGSIPNLFRCGNPF